MSLAFQLMLYLELSYNEKWWDWWMISHFILWLIQEVLTTSWIYLWLGSWVWDWVYLALNPSLWLMKIILLVSTVIRSSIGWMNRREFAAEVMLISSWDCDMVLGVQWLSNLGQIKWDFKELFMQFELDHQQFSPVSVDQRSWRWWQVILIKSWWRMQHICVSCLWWNFPLLV